MYNLKKLKEFSLVSFFLHRNAELIRSEKRQNDAYPRFLNSDISYFGVGGKAAIFFIGQSARVHNMYRSTSIYKMK